MNIEITRSPAAYEPWRPAVRELFSKAFRRPFPEDIWDLYYRNNPFGDTIAALAVDDGKLIGHHALVPQRLVHRDGTAVRYLLSISLMTDTGYRNVFMKLVNASHAAALDSGAAFMIGFPNANGAPPLRRLFGHTPIVETPLLTWTPRRSEPPEAPQIAADALRDACEAFTYPAGPQYWNWRTAVNRAQAVRLNGRTGLVYKLGGDGVITVLDLESRDGAACRSDLIALAFHHQARQFRISGYHAQSIPTFPEELASHEDYLLRFYGRKLTSDIPPIRFCLLLSDVF